MTKVLLKGMLFAGGLLVSAQALAGTHVLCDARKAPLYDKNIKRVLGQVERHDTMNVFQDFFNQTVRIKGKEYVKVELTDRTEEDGDGVTAGYMERALLKTKSACRGFKDVSSDEVDEAVTRVDQGWRVSGLQDPKCCTYPLFRRADHPITQGAARFGARRSRGRRAHAGVDFYTSNSAPIRAVAPGVVLRGPYHFYQRTYAVEVRHSGGFVVRYGEINAKVARGIRAGQKVAMGQNIGKIKKTRCCRPMLHFELYAGTRSGSLSGGGKFRRRSDLINPTQHVLRWERKTF